MRPTPLDWISRVVMLVLAGMVSLSIIGSIAAIPSGTIENRIGIDRPQRAVTEPGERTTPEPRPDQPPVAEADTVSGVPSTSLAPPPPEEADAALWLEAITYALLALVGLAALATLILWRGLKERRRMADALDILAARTVP